LDVDIAHAGLYVNVSVVLKLEVFRVMYFVCGLSVGFAGLLDLIGYIIL